ncbi:MAG: CHRD domain-containing protein, partial [Nitrososphaeraceae archaeon]
MSSTNKGYLVVVIAALASLVLVATATTQSYAQNEKYRAKLDGNNEVPAVNTTAEGVINFKTKNDMLTWKMNVTGANDATGVNIHKGKAGEKGEIVVDLMKVSKHSDNPKGMTMRGNVT